MSLNFPSSPTVGQEYTEGNRTWRWNGRAWDLLAMSDALVARAEQAVIDAQEVAEVAAAAVAESKIQELTDDLASTDPGKGAELVGFKQSGAGAVARSLSDKAREWVSVMDFGAIGDGVADDTAAIQAAVNASTNVYFPPGAYRLNSSVYDAVTQWRHHIIVPENRALLFDSGSKILTTTAYASRAVAFLIRGSNVLISGLDIKDEIEGPSPYIIGVGSGTAYDSSYPVGTLNNLYVKDSLFENNWLSVSVQFVASDSGDKFFDFIRVSNCISKAKESAGSSGNFNFRSDGPWKVKNVILSDCVAFDGKTTSSFNLYGVDGFSLVNCTSHRNTYAGCEMENGAQDGVVTNFRSIDDLWGVWVDDSRRITINGISHKTISETFVTPLLGTHYRYRDAVKITRQGFSGHENWKTEGIVVSNVVSEFGRITISAFGATPSGEFGRITVSNAQIYGDGVARASGNVGIQVGSGCTDLVLTNVLVRGSPTRSIELSIPSGGKHKLTDVRTEKIASESSIGLLTAGLGRLSINDVSVHSASLGNSIIDAIDYRVNDELQPNIFANQRVLHGYSGNPEGNLSGGPGSITFRQDDGKAYIKTAGISNTGWGIVNTFISANANYEPPSLENDSAVTTTVSVVGATVGAHVSASFSVDLQGVDVKAWVSAADTVSVRFENRTGATVNLGYGTINVRVFH